MAQLNIKERQVGKVSVLDLSGKITIGEGSVVVREAVRKLLEGGKTQILLNLKEVTTIDSSGIGELVSSYTTTTRQGGKLKLENLPQKIQDVLMITQLLTVFETYDSESEAVASFN